MTYRNTRQRQNQDRYPAAKFWLRRWDGAETAAEDMNMLQRLRYASDFFFAQAEREMKKRGRVDTKSVFKLMQAGATIASRLAPYVHPKIVAMPLDIEELEKPRQIDLGKLSEDELTILERMMIKATGIDPDEVEEPMFSDE